MLRFKYNSCVGSRETVFNKIKPIIHLNTTLVSVRDISSDANVDFFSNLNTTLVSVRVKQNQITQRKKQNLNTTLVSVRVDQ